MPSRATKSVVPSSAPADVTEAAPRKRTPPKPFAKGHDPRRGVGKKGRSGRPPAEFKDFLRRLRSDPEIQESLESALKDPTCRGFASALKVLTDYDPEKPAEKKSVQGKVEVVVKVVREGRRVTAG